MKNKPQKGQKNNIKRTKRQRDRATRWKNDSPFYVRVHTTTRLKQVEKNTPYQIKSVCPPHNVKYIKTGQERDRRGKESEESARALFEPPKHLWSVALTHLAKEI